MIRKRERGLLHQCTGIVVLQCGALADTTQLNVKEIFSFSVSQTPWKRLWWLLFLERERVREVN